MEQILDNAITSIELGVIDLRSARRGRPLSAIRNLHSGVLLLCKAVLYAKSPEGKGSLIFKRLVPTRSADGEINWIPSGRQTIDRQEIKERFRSLGLEVDWRKLDALGDIRNEIEHLYTRNPDHLLKEALAGVMPLIRELLVSHLNTSPQLVFSKPCWQTLLQNEEVYAAESAECDRTFNSIDWPESEVAFPLDEMRCTECESSLLEQFETENSVPANMQLHCRHCDVLPQTAEVLSRALEKATEGDAYIAMTDGGEPPVTHCPECTECTFLRDAATCVACDFLFEDSQCAVCGNSINPDEYDPDYPHLCSYHAHLLAKDD